MTCAADSTWLGCWWRGFGDGAPPQWFGVSRLVARRRPGIVPASDARVPSRFVRCPGDGAPRNGRESIGSSPVVARVACLLIERSIALSISAVPVSLLTPPPSPCPRTTVLVRIPSRPTGEYFRGRPAGPPPVGSPWPRTLRPPNRCHGPLPFPLSPFLCHACGPFAPIPKSEISGGPVSRSNPAPRARARP